MTSFTLRGSVSQPARKSKALFLQVLLRNSSAFVIVRGARHIASSVAGAAVRSQHEGCPASRSSSWLPSPYDRDGSMPAATAARTSLVLPRCRAPPPGRTRARRNARGACRARAEWPARVTADDRDECLDTTRRSNVARIALSALALTTRAATRRVASAISSAAPGRKLARGPPRARRAREDTTPRHASRAHASTEWSRATSRSRAVTIGSVPRPRSTCPCRRRPLVRARRAGRAPSASRRRDRSP